MTQVFLTTASSSPWSIPGDWSDSGATVELLAAAGDGAIGGTGANPRGGGGGGGGEYIKLTSGSIAGAGSIAFRVGPNSAANRNTTWEENTGTSGNNYIAFGGSNATTTAGGGGGNSGGLTGTPAFTYTVSLDSWGGTGGSNAATNRASGGGGGAGGPNGAGAVGGSPTSTGGGGGGGSDGGSAGASPSTSAFGAGGNGFGGTGGGATSGAAGSAGTGGGGAGTSAVASGSAGTGGAGSAHTTSGPWDSTHGPGSGGGGGGQVTGTGTSQVSNGGNGANYGGGGGGTGGLRGSGSQTAGTAPDGLIAITYTPSSGGSTVVEGWRGQLSKAPAIVALPVAVALTWCPQPITPAVAAAPSLGWQGQLSVAPPIVNVARSFSYVPFNTVQPSNYLNSLAWQQPLSRAVPLGPAPQSFGSVPFNTAQPVAVTLTTGWQQPLSTAPKLASVPYSQTQLVPLDNPQVFLGWQGPLSIAPVRAVIQGSSLSFIVPPFEVPPRGWQSQLSTAPPSLAKARDTNQAFPFYPVVAVPDNTVTLDKWQRPLSNAPPIVQASRSFSYVPFNTAQIVVTTVNLQWQQPLSAAPPSVKASQSFSYVPFNTPQVAVQVSSYGWLSALSVAPQAPRAVYTWPSFVALSFSQVNWGWQQPLSQAVKSNSVVPSQWTFVSVPVEVPRGWYQALSVAPLALKAPQSFAFVPLNTPQITAQVVSVAWQQPLSIAPPRPSLSRGSSFVPLDTAQSATIAGMAWFTPLGVAPKVSYSGHSPYSVWAFSTEEQLAPENPPRQRHPGAQITVRRPGGFLGRYHISMSLADDSHQHIGDANAGYLGRHRLNTGHRTAELQRRSGGLRGFLRKNR